MGLVKFFFCNEIMILILIQIRSTVESVASPATHFHRVYIIHWQEISRRCHFSQLELCSCVDFYSPVGDISLMRHHILPCKQRSNVAQFYDQYYAAIWNDARYRNCRQINIASSNQKKSIINIVAVALKIV